MSAKLIDSESEPGAYADAIAHSPCLRVEDYKPRTDAGIADEAKT